MKKLIVDLRKEMENLICDILRFITWETIFQKAEDCPAP